MSKSRLKLFLENMLCYGGISMLSKALPFITLPIITKLIPDSSNYGIFDMFNLINSFGVSIAILGMYDAVFREYFEEKDNVEYKKKVTSTGLNIVIISGIIVMCFLIIFSNKLSILLFGIEKYSNLIKISGFSVLVGASSVLVGAPTRMENKKMVYLVTGLSLPLIGFLVTYIYLKRGYTYEALIFGTMIMGIVSLVLFSLLNKSNFDFKIFDKKIAKELFKIGLPLIPTFLIYWIYNSMDRIMINRMLGSNELGVYSIGNRVASISQLIYMAFAGGWQYFSFSTMKDDDQVELNSKIFEYLGIISFILYIFSLPLINPVFNLFFTGEYTRGEEVFSYLFLSPLILMLFQILGNQILIIKKTYLSTVSLSFGAILNLILNYYLIKKYGIKGAAFATLSSYFISVILLILICKKYRLVVIKKRFIYINFIMWIGIFNSFYFEKYYYSCFILVLILSIIFYFKDFLKLIGGKNE